MQREIRTNTEWNTYSTWTNKCCGINRPKEGRNNQLKKKNIFIRQFGLRTLNSMKYDFPSCHQQTAFHHGTPSTRTDKYGRFHHVDVYRNNYQVNFFSFCFAKLIKMWSQIKSGWFSVHFVHCFSFCQFNLDRCHNRLSLLRW